MSEGAARMSRFEQCVLECGGMAKEIEADHDTKNGIKKLLHWECQKCGAYYVNHRQSVENIKRYHEEPRESTQQAISNLLREGKEDGC
jgi:hypothetical protein